MKFILGLLIGGGLVFGWYYRNDASDAAEKAKVRADYAAQLKAAEDQVERLNAELIKTRADLVDLKTTRAKPTNMVETVYVSPRLEQPVNNPISAPPKVAEPVPKQTKPVAPVKSGLGGPRPASPAKTVAPPPGGGLMYNDGQGRSYRIVNGKRIYY